MRKHFVWTFISLTKTATQLFIMPFVLCCIVLIINACDNFLPVGPDGNTCEYDGLFDPATIVEVNIEMAPAKARHLQQEHKLGLPIDAKAPVRQVVLRATGAEFH